MHLHQHHTNRKGPKMVQSAAPGSVPKVTTALALTSRVLQTISEFTQNPKMPTQQVMIYLAVAAAGEIPQADLEKLSRVSANAVSRHIAALGEGSPSEQGYGLVESYEDPEWRRRKLVRTTARGKELAKQIGANTARFFR